MNFSLVFETAVTIALIYLPGTEKALRFYALSPYFWLPALPFAIMVWIFDEGRKYFVRKDRNGFIAKLTYY